MNKFDNYHLVCLRTIPSEKKTAFLIGKTRRDDRKHFKKCQVHLFKFECSRFFNLKPYGGSFTKSVHFQSMKNQWRFLWKDQVKNFKKVYGVTKCNLKVFLFWWEISLAHIKRGYSGPGNAGGVCSSVASVMSGGSLYSHCLLQYVLKFIMSIQEIIIISQNICLKRINCVYFVLIKLFINLLPLCLGFP